MEVQLLQHLPVGIGQAGEGVADHHRGGDAIGVVGCRVTLLGVEVEGAGISVGRARTARIRSMTRFLATTSSQPRSAA